MSSFHRSPTWLGMCLAAPLLLVGCGPSGPPRFQAVGTILLHGKPLPVPTDAPPGTLPVQVQLMPDIADPSQLVSPEECSYDAATGKFTTTGDEEHGVEAGKYHLVVAPYGNAALTEKFAKDSTPVVVEVKATGALDPAVIELSHY